MPEAVTHSFQAEVSQVLNLVIHSLYSHKEIFLRELVSNASDALDKLRFRAITEPDLFEGDSTLVIRIHADPDKGTLTIEDNGIGMSEEELVRDLGTVAHSGSRAFLEKLAEGAKKDARLIGQFGVGFYSSYLVSDRVEVVSRPAGKDGKAHMWRSDGKETFTILPDDRAARGTAVVLHVRADQKDLLEEWRLRELVTRYSDYVGYPIELEVKTGTGSDAKTEWQKVNQASALWRRPKSEITDEQTTELYRHLSHGGEEDAPLARTHFRVEGTQEFTGLLFVPRERPMELRFGMKHKGVRLYVKRVLIMDDCEEIVPEWLRFIVGVIDSDDLPLNVSRELLQESSAVRTIKKQVVKHVVDAIEEVAKDRPEDYAGFWKNFGVFLKEGLATDFEHKERLSKLLRYESTHGEGLTSLAEYVGRMKEGQPAIYYVVGESRRLLEGTPHSEGLKKRGYEVLFMTDPIDEWATEQLRAFDGKPLVSAMRSDLKLDGKDDKKEAEAPPEAGDLGPLLLRMRATLEGKVKDVRVSDRLTDSPCCLVLAGRGPHGFVQRLMREAGRDVPKTERILEVNPTHPIVRNLRAMAEGDPMAQETTLLLYDQAVVAEGGVPDDPVGFVKRMSELMAKATAPPSRDKPGA